MTSPSPDNGQTGQGPYTVHEAALLLGLSVEAVRKRAERGKLSSIKGEDGTRYILLDADQTKTGPSPDNDQTELIEALYGQIEFLREELAALERIPAIEPPDEDPPAPREEPETASPEMEGVEVPLAEEKPQRSFWRKFFGL